MIVYRVELKCLATGRWFPIYGGTYPTRPEAVRRAEVVAGCALPSVGIRVRKVVCVASAGGAQ